MICDNCGQEGAYIRPTSKAYGAGDSLIVIEAVPMISCRNCGIDFISADTLHQLDEIKATLRSKPASHSDSARLVRVAVFQSAAQSSAPIYGSEPDAILSAK